MKLWLDEHNSIDFEDTSLTDQIAVRSRSLDWIGLEAILPDPDPVLRKTGDDMTVYRMLLSDAHVWSCVQSRKSGTLSCEVEVRESANGGSARANRRARDLCQQMLNHIDVYQVISDMLDAPLFGMSPIEIVWSTNGGATNGSVGAEPPKRLPPPAAWLPSILAGKPPEWFAFDTDNRLRFLTRWNMIEGELLPDKRFLLPRHHATYQNPYGERVLSKCFWPVTFKRSGFKFWAIFTEKFGMPWVIGKVPRGTNETERGLLLTALSEMVQDAVAVINDDERIEIPEIWTKQASADVYERLIAGSNKEISKAILGQTLSTEVSDGGSYAAAKSHLEVRQDLVDQDKRMVAEAFNILFRWITELNVPGASAPTLHWFEEEDIQADRATRDKTLTEQGVKLSRTYYLRTYNLEPTDMSDQSNPSDISSSDSSQFAAAPARAGALKDPLLRAGRDGQAAVDALGADLARRSGARFAEKIPRMDINPAGVIDVISAKALADTALDSWIDPIKDLLDQSSSLEDFRDRLLDIYRDLDPSALGDTMAQAMALADLTGKFDAID